ncbi:MAG: glyoxalase [Candidatus Staskawiczbacteria bacterium RIFOXYD1_FULL_39_28]|uniref:Glyoxalase n=1 Tax=Candidatus Staskawiczbacteria bacterium RIFOXYC1_FULL_38_18 TaxID=1802229 RepID=A0A1G2J9I5_9BACT|nr:MAG: glyoxalase [Candidatus Staskawiczbacteria bacterium RIFOXYC1_FULL_38_18]OGZ91997.1 MAG: glyoxalase [Candidatus Staskawiczbacteria bacterium RIFOXYD1_FULL_39_28]
MDKVVHFELPADNTDRAKKFYQESFDWQITDYPEMKYTIIRTAETDENMMIKESGAINGGLFKKGEGENPVVAPSFSVDVKDIDEAIKKIKNAGGLILKDKTQVGEMGYVAYFKDTEGNILSVWQNILKK